MNPQAREAIVALAASYPAPKAALLGALEILQREEGGHLDAKDLSNVAALLRVPLATVYATASYYTMLNLEPVGSYHLQIDTNIPATLAGSEALLAHLEKALGIGVGETTPDGLFTIQTVACMGCCSLAPVMTVNESTFGKMSPDAAIATLERVRSGQLELQG